MPTLTDADPAIPALPALPKEAMLKLIEEHLGLMSRRDDTVVDNNTGRWTDAARYYDLMTAAIAAAGRASRVQGEAKPFGWYGESRFENDFTTSEDTSRRWSANGYRLTPLYTAPQAETLAVAEGFVPQAEFDKRLRVSILQGDVIANHVIAMQAAIIEAAQVSPKEGLRWIFNTLRGPGFLPDMDEANRLGSAQAWFDAKTAEHEAFRAANPGPAEPRMVAVCCGRFECGGECGNEWQGEEAAPTPTASSQTADDFSGIKPPMRNIAGVSVDVLRRAALAAPKAEGEAVAGERQFYQHVKSGGVYELVCRAIDEANPEVSRVIYRSATGVLWDRIASEFDDGRFVHLATYRAAPVAQAPKAEAESFVSRWTRAIQEMPSAYEHPAAVPVAQAAVGATQWDETEEQRAFEDLMLARWKNMDSPPVIKNGEYQHFNWQECWEIWIASSFRRTTPRPEATAVAPVAGEVKS